MKRTLIVALLAVFGASFGMVASATAQPRHFGAHLSGGGEVPAVDTTAQGQVGIRVSRDGSELAYTLVVANIENVVASHIHCAPEGVNGPVGVTLFGGSVVTTNGPLVEGVISAPNPGNACGWASVSDIVAAIESGSAYVNVHTTGHPGGEIRGQLR